MDEPQVERLIVAFDTAMVVGSSISVSSPYAVAQVTCTGAFRKGVCSE